MTRANFGAMRFWDMNWLLINKFGFNPNVQDGYIVGGSNAGNVLALRLVMDALKIQPANPSFKDARDAILQADVVLTGGANQYENLDGVCPSRHGLELLSTVPPAPLP